MDFVSATVLHVYLSRVGDNLHVAVDGNAREMLAFGISVAQFTAIAEEIDKVIQKILLPKNDKFPESKL